MPKPIGPGPRTKEELVNKMMSFDFSGDIRDLGEDTRVEREAANSVKLTFPKLGRSYILSVHIPRDEAPAKPTEVTWAAEPAAKPKRTPAQK